MKNDLQKIVGAMFWRAAIFLVELGILWLLWLLWCACVPSMFPNVPEGTSYPSYLVFAGSSYLVRWLVWFVRNE